MAETKKYAQWIDIPDGKGGSERKWLKDAEARDMIKPFASIATCESIINELT